MWYKHEHAEFAYTLYMFTCMYVCNHVTSHNIPRGKGYWYRHIIMWIEPQTLHEIDCGRTQLTNS